MKFNPLVLLFTFLFVLSYALMAAAQTPQPPATPTQVEMLVIPNIGDPATVASVNARTTAISASSSNCNLPAPSGTPPETLTNPVGPVWFTDPFNANRFCSAPLPTPLADGSYRVVARFIAPTCNPTGTAVVSPCPGPRSAVGVPPFSIVSPTPAPGAPTGLLISQ